MLIIAARIICDFENFGKEIKKKLAENSKNLLLTVSVMDLHITDTTDIAKKEHIVHLNWLKMQSAIRSM